ncbi:MAG: DUF1552 domain-containing protein [Verrucomicrobia bacterium]|nr:DUF1552 domain-containing protein [Verrucomicrobiota bacterium]
MSPNKATPLGQPAVLTPDRWRIPRRTFLRGAGALLGLPMLDAMGKVISKSSPSAKASRNGAGEIQAPVRLCCIYFPNGVWEKTWFPEKAGPDYTMPSALEPLAAHRDNLLVFSGLDKKHSHGGDGHYAKTANFLTGLLVRKTAGKDIHVGGMSIDQHCAQQLGHLTPLPSLELGIDPVISGIDSVVGYTRLYGCYISWRSPSQPVAKEINPRLGYERLFGVMQARGLKGKELRKQQDNQALLDLVLDDARQLRQKLGRDDQYKLDEYLDSVRDVEKRLEFFSKPDPRVWKPASGPGPDLAAPKGTPGDHQEHVRLMLDLIVMAFWTDSTRVGSFMFANDVSGKNFGKIVPGTGGSHHEFSHHQNKAEKFEPYSKINQWHAAQLAYMMDKMASIKEGERTLLDNSLTLFGSSMSDGNRHDPSNLPILLAGKAGAKIKSGRHIASKKGTPLCNLYVSMLGAMGTPVESFGDSTEAMSLC